MKNLSTILRMKRMFVIRLLFSFMFMGSLLALCFAVEASATDVTLRLVDQNGALIPASQFQVLTPPGGTVQNGGTISLPDGSYSIRLCPGIDGVAQTSHLYRDEIVTVSGSTQTVDFVWVTATLQLNLVDQNNVLIPQSQIAVGKPNVFFLETLPNGSSVILPVTDDPNTPSINGSFANGYPARLYPGLNGNLQGGQLYRDDPEEELTATGLVKTFTWVTATLQLNLVDQNNVLIPQSQIAVGKPNVFFLETLPNGSSVILPVTDDPNTPSINGSFANGYPARLYPGLNGNLQGGQLYRDDPEEELTATGLVRTFTWVTATLQLNLVDQNNVLIPQSQIAVGKPNVFFLETLPNGSSVILPVTDDPNTPSINGSFANGYPARLYPGLNGNLQGGQLYRDDPEEELTAAGLVRIFIWETVAGTLHVVDALENEVSGASIQQSFLGTIGTGTFVSIPVTDNSLYPTIAGRYANGYDDFYIQTAPANPFAGAFTFKFLSGKIIDPAFVTIDGAQYGLRFDLQSMPVCAPPPSGLVSWWPGDDNANDIKSNNHGTLQNGATFGSGVVAQAFSLDGVDDFVSINTFNALDGLSNATFEFWINMNAFPSDPSCNSGSCGIVLFSKNDFVFAIGIHSSLAIEVSRGNGSNWGGDFTLSNGALTGLNQWNHVAVVIDGTTDKIYINGVSNTTNTQVENSFANFGGLVFGSGFSGDYIFLDAELDEVTIYNRALSASEIQSIYNAGSAGKCKECTPPEVSITGNESVCPNTTQTYTANTNAANSTFEWSVTGGTINGDNTGSSVSVTAGGAGTMTVSVEVTDGATNCSNSVTQNVTVEDNQAPVITVTTNPITLWPPNHQYVTINVSQCVTAVTDNCATLSANNVMITKVTSDEPEDAKGGGDGNTKTDMVIASNCQSVQLRSEREGSGNGRVYTIHLSVNDDNGNTGTATCLVTVPKSQNGNPAVDDGPVYTVGSSCGSGTSKLTAEDIAAEMLPENYALEQNYPNPFNPSTVISFQLPVNAGVKLAIYSITGEVVRELVNGEMNAGRHAINWNGRDRVGNTVAAGMYLYRLVAHGANGEVVFTQTRRMAFVK